MKLKDRIQKLESIVNYQEVIEFAFKECGESEEDAIEKAKRKFPNANKFIVVSWIKPTVNID